MRERVFRDYIGVLTNTFRQFTTFKVVSVRNVLTNVSFKGSKGPRHHVPTQTDSRNLIKFAKVKLPNFNLAETFLHLQPHYNTDLRKIVFNPVVTDSNKIQIVLLKVDGKGKKNGTITIYSSGTCMFMGFKSMKTILDEFHVIRKVLGGSGYTVVNP